MRLAGTPAPGTISILSLAVMALTVFGLVAPHGPIQAAIAADEETTWSNLNPAGSPSPRLYPGFVYDLEEARFVLFGGGANFEVLNETWSYDLGTNTWANMSPSPHPWGLAGAAFAYDSADRLSLLFGTGGPYQGQINSTWSYDHSKNRWTDLNAANAPSVRYFCQMAYDSLVNKMILFGGVRYEGPYAFVFNETWSYDFTSNAWVNMEPATHPPARFGNALVYDSQSNRVIMFGGRWQDVMSVVPDVWMNDTWAYDYDMNAWTNVTPTNGPSARESMAATYDRQTDKVVVFGGKTVNATLNETWVYDYESNQWTVQDSATIPPWRFGAGMAYGLTAQEAVLFGGMTQGYVLLNDTWSYGAMEPIPEFSILLAPALGTIAMGILIGRKWRGR